MRLYELARLTNYGMDEVDGFVIRARSHRAARKIAAENASGEGSNVWLNAKKTSCSEIKPEQGEPGVVLSSFNAG